ncbi:hypothetical protein [Umezawaea sp.]|uniref:hypothetical protein n=1 Tax=Umezawaea sp. TaxID=1955258 RepID=UPI002ECFC296
MPVRRITTVLVVASAAVLGLSGVASASGEVVVPGARLTFDTPTHVFTLYDTADDGHAVYARWQVQGSSPVVGYNRGGPGSVARWYLDTPTGLRITYQVCVDTEFQDVCSPTRVDRT